MKKYIFLILLLLSCIFPLTVSAETIYLDLSLGNVTINTDSKKFSGRVAVNGEDKIYSGVSFSNTTTFYIYQSSTIAGSPWNTANTGYSNNTDFNNKQNIRLPQYDPMMVGSTLWTDYITNNPSVEDVAEKWESAAAAVQRSSSGHIIRVYGNKKVPVNIVIDNIWSSFCENTESTDGFRDGGISIRSQATSLSSSTGRTTTNEQVTVRLKGDSRLSNIYYSNNSVGNGYLKITSYDGDGNDSGSLTVAYPHNTNVTLQSRNNDAIIGCGNGTYQCGGDVYNLFFNGGTVFAGCQQMKNHTFPSNANHPIIHVIGGRQGSGITVNGGRLTAVNNGTDPAIGGGGGYVNDGGKDSNVTINGGEVYAYNHGVISGEHRKFVPCTAIGAGSCVRVGAGKSQVTITGGYVYAQSNGGVAIGGGGSSEDDGGTGNVTITGGEVHATSLSGEISGYSFPAGTAIGGGTGYAKGGSSAIKISGTNTIVRTGSVGGGMYTKSSGGQFGIATVNITDGDIQAQFIMQATSASAKHCKFEMTGGIIHDSSSESTDYPLRKSDGGALWINDPGGVVTITDATIQDCTAQNGGAIYQTGGTITISGTSNIFHNTALKNGGGAYISGGTTNFKANISNNTALNGGGLYLASGAQMTFKGGLIINNEAIQNSSSPATTAYRGTGGSTIEGCGGGIYLQNGSNSTHKTTLNFELDPLDKTFGLYMNKAAKGGDDIVSEGQYTEVVLPSVREMQLYGFDGQDATPFWYQDYFTDDTGYSNSDGHAVEGTVSHVDRFRNIIEQYTNDYFEHRIPDERLETIKNNYLCLTLSYNMLDITLTANHLLGKETALFQLVRHGSVEDKKYDVLLKAGADGIGSRTLRNMPWGTYSVIPNDSWNWAYDKIPPQFNLRLGETGNYEFIFDMKHKNAATMPNHDERYK